MHCISRTSLGRRKTRLRTPAPSGTPRGLASVLVGVTALACVATSQPAAAAPDRAAPAAANTVTTVLRPNATHAAFAISGAATAAKALDDPVTAGRPVRATDLIRGKSGATTTVDLADRSLGGVKPTSSKVWFYATTGSRSSVRIEVLESGVVTAVGTIASSAKYRWRSVTIRPSSQAHANALQVRFVQVKGQSRVKAIYASVGRARRSAVILRPSGDVRPFAVEPSGRASAAVDDDVTSAAPPARTDHLAGHPTGASTQLGLTNATLSGSPPTASSAWVYAETGARTSLVLEVVGDGAVRAHAAIRPNTSPGWHRVNFAPRSAAALEALSLRLSAVGGSHARIDAAYVAVETAGRADSVVGRYLQGLPEISADQTLSDIKAGPTSEPYDEIVADPKQQAGKLRYRCTTTPRTLSGTPDQIVIQNPDVNKLWLGGLLQGQGYQQGIGSLRELPIRERTPVTIFINVLGDRVSTTVPHPDAASMQQAIADLVRRAESEAVPFPYIASYQSDESTTAAQQMLKIGVSAKYLGASASADLDVSRDASEHTVVASFVQRMFTVSIVSPKTPGGYFSPGFTRADLDEQVKLGRISADNPPVVISNISYGRRLMYSMTSSHSAAKIKGALDAAYSGGVASGSVKVSAEQQDILDNARYGVTYLGGEQKPSEALIRTHQLGDYFTGHASPRTAVPISYQFDNVAGHGGAAKFVDSTNYNLTECGAIPNTAVPASAGLEFTPQVTVYGRRGGTCSMYGSLALNGVTFWDKDKGGKLQDLPEHTVVTLRGAEPRVLVQSDQGYVLGVGQPLQLTGSLSCDIFIGGDPANVWKAGDATWTVPDDPRAGARFTLKAVGGSKHNPVDVTVAFTVKSVQYNYQP